MSSPLSSARSAPAHSAADSTEPTSSDTAVRSSSVLDAKARGLGGKHMASRSDSDAALRRPSLNWGDMLSEDSTDQDENDSAPLFSVNPAAIQFPPDAPSKDAAQPCTPQADARQAHSLLIQSFSGISPPSLGSVTDDASPDSDGSPTPLVPQLHQTTVGFNMCPVPEAAAAGSEEADLLTSNLANLRVSVTIDPEDGHRQGYAGLLRLSKRSQQGGGCSSPSLEPLQASDCNEQVRVMVTSTSEGLSAGLAPEAALDGMGGTYFMPSASGDKAAIFKPCDEEPLAPNNPKQWQGRAMGAPGMKSSVRVGEAALREVAAYWLDHDGFAGVPPACLVNCYHPALSYKVTMPRIESLQHVAKMSASLVDASAPATESSMAASDTAASGNEAAAPESPAAPPQGGLARALQRANSATISAAPCAKGPKLGSLQQFVTHKCDAAEMSSSCFSADNVHRIGVLDVRLLNCDRHTGNLLVCEGGSAATGSFAAPYTLVPIDHGYALPEALDNPYFEWLFWPQTSVPFSADVKAYVARLDARADVALLREKVPMIRDECLRCLEATTKVLQICVAAGLTLHELGVMFTRPDTAGTVPSDFEVLCMDARDHTVTSGATTPVSAPSLDASPFCPSSPTSGHLGAMFQMTSNGSLPPAEPFDPDSALLMPAGARMSAVGADEGPHGVAVGPQLPQQTRSPSPVAHLFDPSRLSGSAINGAAMFATPAGVPLNMAASLGPNNWHSLTAPRPMRSAWRSKHGGAPAKRGMPGTHVAQVNYVFTDLSDEQWQAFMVCLERDVYEEARAGTWKISRTTGANAGSCPVAFTERPPGGSL